MELNDWYSMAYKEYTTRSNEKEIYLEYLRENKNNIGLTTSTSLLSIGPAKGDMDVPLVRDCIPQLQSYTAIDVDGTALNGLRERLHEEGFEDKMKIALSHDDVTTWRGPEQPVDIVFMCHVLYFIAPESRVNLLRRSVTWLKPGGKLIIVILKRTDNAWYRCAEKFGVSAALYSAVNARLDLSTAGLKSYYMDDGVSYTIDMGHRNKELMKFFLFKNATDEECAATDTYFGEILPADRTIVNEVALMTLRKEDFTMAQ